MAGKGKPLKGVGTAGPYSGDIKRGKHFDEVYATYQVDNM